MGQGYKAIILASEPHKGKEVIRTWVDPHAHDNGYKLMEHSYIGNNFVEALEYLISPLGMFYKSRLVWSGDYVVFSCLPCSVFLPAFESLLVFL